MPRAPRARRAGTGGACGQNGRMARRILGIAGAPGEGKSTYAERLVAEADEPAAYLPMDGFHLADAALSSLGLLRPRRWALLGCDAWSLRRGQGWSEVPRSRDASTAACVRRSRPSLDR